MDRLKLPVGAQLNNVVKVPADIATVCDLRDSMKCILNLHAPYACLLSKRGEGIKVKCLLSKRRSQGEKPISKRGDKAEMPMSKRRNQGEMPE